MVRNIAKALGTAAALAALGSASCSARPPNVSVEEMEARIEAREEAIRRESLQHAGAEDEANPIGFHHAPAPTLPASSPPDLLASPTPDLRGPLGPHFAP